MTVFANRVQMTTATTGTGTVTLGSATTGFQSFASGGIVNGDLVSYLITDGTAWEVGTGTYTSSGTTLSRSLTQSSTGSLLNLSGAAVVSIIASAGDFASMRFTRCDVITATGNFTPATGITEVYAIVFGAGGGGGGNSGGAGGTGGTGGPGGIASGILSVSGAVLATIGAGGTGSNTAAGSAGGTTTFSTLSATGGAGGALTDTGPTAASGTGSGGAFNSSSSLTTLQRAVDFGGVVTTTLAVTATVTSFARPRAVSSTAAVAYSTANSYGPGSGGQGETASNSNAAGGVNGAVFVLY